MPKQPNPTESTSLLPKDSSPRCPSTPVSRAIVGAIPFGFTMKNGKAHPNTKATMIFTFALSAVAMTTLAISLSIAPTRESLLKSPLLSSILPKTYSLLLLITDVLLLSLLAGKNAVASLLTYCCCCMTTKVKTNKPQEPEENPAKSQQMSEPGEEPIETPNSANQHAQLSRKHRELYSTTLGFSLGTGFTICCMIFPAAILAAVFHKQLLQLTESPVSSLIIPIVGIPNLSLLVALASGGANSLGVAILNCLSDLSSEETDQDINEESSSCCPC